MQDLHTAAVILIGDELLSGSIKDENLAHIAVTLEAHGIRVRECRVVPDEEQDIVAAVNTLRAKHDYVFTTGGVGPTHDDITSDSIAAAFGVPNVVQQKVFDIIQGYLDRKGVEFTPAAQRMAYAPKGAEVIYSDQSIVPGYRMENVYVMAGVPRIMKMMLTAIVDTLEGGAQVLSREVHANVSEGDFAAALESIQRAHPEVAIGSYPQDPDSQRSNYRVVFVIKGTDLAVIKQTCEEILSACRERDIDAAGVGVA